MARAEPKGRDDGALKSAAANVSASRRASNVRTALVLVSIALVFFVGIIVKYWLA